MISEARRRVYLPWVALSFSAALSLITLVAQLALSFTGLSGGWSGWSIPFVGFLPMCFYFVGAANSQMQVEILELRQQVAELRAVNIAE